MKRILIILFMLWGVAYAQPCADEDTVRSNAVTLITYNSARINGSISHFSGVYVTLILKYVRAGQTDTTSASGVNPLRNLTGLQANTLYYYYYSTICGSSFNNQLGIYSFTTLQSTVIYTPMPAQGYQFKYLKADSGFIVPRLDTGLNKSPNIGGQIKFRPADSTFYGYNGEIWKPLAIDSSGIIALLNDKVDSVTVAGDSLWYWKQGVSYGYILPTQANEWKLLGNASTTAGTNFVGTTDAVNLQLRTNGAKRFTINTSGAFGLGTGEDYGTAGYILSTTGSGSAPTWINHSTVFPTWQQTLNVTNGNILTQDNDIDDDGSGRFLRFGRNVNFADIAFEASASITAQANLISLSGGDSISVIGSKITLANTHAGVTNKININPAAGALYIDTLTNNVGLYAMRWNPTTGLVSYADTTTGGGSAALTATYVGYGDGSNVLTGEAALTYDAANNILAITGSSAANFPFAITNNVNGVTGFKVTNTSAGAAAQIQNQLVNDVGSLAYYGIPSSNFSGYAPLDGGKAFFGANGAPVSIFTQTTQPILFYPNGVLAMSIINGGNVGAGITAPTSILHSGGSFAAGYVAKSANYTATISDFTIECTANTFQVTLPTSVGITGRIYNIVNSGAGVITIATTSSQTFINVVATPTTLTLSAVGTYQVQSNGANWMVLSVN